MTEKAPGLTAQQIQFAKECADPRFSLSVPEPAKQVIRDLLAEVDRLEDTITRAVDSINDGPHRRVAAARKRGLTYKDGPVMLPIRSLVRLLEAVGR